MKTSKLFFASAIIFSMGISAADAQIKDHAQNQKERIKQGVKSGELTKNETQNIIQDEKEIRQDIKLAKADGDITRDEKMIILKEQKQVSREIYRKKHNCRDRN
jgi:hypothetical protein